MSQKLKEQVHYTRQIEGVSNALPSGLAAVCAALAAGALTAFLLGSGALLNWANNLPIGPAICDFVLNQAQNWQDTLATLHLTAFADWFTALLAWCQSLR